jgi:YD repeat-containing protein
MSPCLPAGMWFKTTEMKIRLNIFFAIAVVLLTSGAYAQSLPDITYQDYGYTKPIKKVTQLYYSIDYANDGSVKNVEEVEKVTQTFNTDGKIESYENQSFLDESWAKSQSAYKQGRLHKQVWTHSNPYLNRTYTYVYDKQGRITEEKIRFKDGSKSHIKFRYKDSLLTEIEADIDGTQSVTERYYSAKGKLYKEIHRQKVPNEADIVTNYFYLEDKEILSYVEPKSYFYATAYLKDVKGHHSGEIKFKLIEDSTAQNKLLKGILRFDIEAPNDNLPFDLEAYSDQTLQAYEKNKDELKPCRMVLYLRDENNNIYAEAEVDLKARKITGIGFFKTEFADGTTTGTIDFRHKRLHIFEAMLEQTKLP